MMGTIFQTLISSILIIGATSAPADLPTPVLDTDGNPLVANGEYYIMPAATESGGPINLQSRTNKPCPLFLGQLNATTGDGTDFLAVRFSPYDDQVVRLDSNFRAAFSAGELCSQVLTWKAEQDWLLRGQRRPIGMGIDDEDDIGMSNLFKIGTRVGFDDVYVIYWCPSEFCPLCRLACSSMGLEFVNGKRMFALDGDGTDFPFPSDFPVVFQRVYYTNTN